MAFDKDAINEAVARESKFVHELIREVEKVIVGQKFLVQRLLVGLLANGHILVESVPGLAKTTAIKTLALAVKAKFARLQFTPDLLPADVIGTMIYNPQTQTFTTKKGPIFANLVLADEINRSPAKVQSSLLEAMQERQVTIGENTFKLDDPFLVMATQNPIEQEGTYPLPEAQVDRFMLKIKITYPEPDEELLVVNRMGETNKQVQVTPVTDPADIVRARKFIDQIYLDDKLKRYIINLVFATRFPEKYNMPELKGLIQVGASPRASINLVVASKAFAFIQGRGYVTPEDIKSVGYDILNHRVMLSYEAEAEEKTPEDIIKTIFEKTPIP